MIIQLCIYFSLAKTARNGEEGRTVYCTINASSFNLISYFYMAAHRCIVTPFQHYNNFFLYFTSQIQIISFNVDVKFLIMYNLFRFRVIKNIRLFLNNNLSIINCYLSAIVSNSTPRYERYYLLKFNINFNFFFTLLRNTRF